MFIQRFWGYQNGQMSFSAKGKDIIFRPLILLGFPLKISGGKWSYLAQDPLSWF